MRTMRRRMRRMMMRMMRRMMYLPCQTLLKSPVKVEEPFVNQMLDLSITLWVPDLY